MSWQCQILQRQNETESPSIISSEVYVLSTGTVALSVLVERYTFRHYSSYIRIDKYSDLELLEMLRYGTATHYTTWETGPQRP